MITKEILSIQANRAYIYRQRHRERSIEESSGLGQGKASSALGFPKEEAKHSPFIYLQLETMEKPGWGYAPLGGSLCRSRGAAVRNSWALPCDPLGILGNPLAFTRGTPLFIRRLLQKNPGTLPYEFRTIPGVKL